MLFTWASLIAVLLLTTGAASVAILALNRLFPRPQRRDPEEVGPALPGWLPRERPGHRPEVPPLTIIETRAVVEMSPIQRRDYWRGNVRLIGGLLVLWMVCAYVPAFFAT